MSLQVIVSDAEMALGRFQNEGIPPGEGAAAVLAALGAGA